ncbi:MAG TPA: hypothetical protein G4N99_02140 [Thermoflexia bacterium]|nr:hypothetical protein [Thermoflexia bacterium]
MTKDTRARRPNSSACSTRLRERIQRRLPRPAVASALVALALTGLLYGDTLALPLFSDDLVQIPWLESISWRELWASPSPYGYYRPLWYSLWRLWGVLVGGLHPPGLHLLNLIAHFAAAWLAGLLAVTWMRRGAACPRPYIPACLAAALFAVFPFSRQAVAWPGAVYNPLVSAMAAGAVLSYDRGRQGHGQWWIGLALLLAGLAPLTYEAGLLVAPLVILTEGLGWLQGRWSRRYSWWPLAFAGLCAAALALWRAMRGAGVTSFGLNPSDLYHNAAYLVQGLVYPVAPLAQRLAAWLELDTELCLWLIALPTLALLAWSGLKRNRSAFSLGAIWFALFALPPAVSMEADWFALAPRFLYMTAAGGALMWTAAAGDWITRLRRSWHTPLIVVVLAALLIPAALFVRDGMHLYRMAGESIWDAAEATQSPILLVNLPMRITPHGRAYPLGFEGVTPLPMRVTAEELVRVHTGIRDAAEAVAFGIVAADDPPDYDYQLFGREAGWEELAAAVRQARAVYLTRYENKRIHLVEAGSASEPISGEPLARFGDRVALLKAECTCDARGQVHLTAHWQVETSVKTDATVFAHLLDSEGALAAQADGYPLLGMLPFWLWEPGEVVRDTRHFDPVQAGEYTIRLGMWELATGERWLADNQPDGVMLLPVRCP